MNKLRKLTKGNKIGVFSSSSPTNKEAMERLTKYFNEKGFDVVLAPNVFSEFGYLAGLPEQRASDFNSLLKDPSISLLMTATGGKGAIQLLKIIDYDIFKSSPRILCGLSDPTTLINAISKMCQIPTFHGPNGYNFGHTNPTKFTESVWWQIVSGSFTLPYKYPLPSFNILKAVTKDKYIEGKIFGGNLGVLMNLIGTPYEPNWNGAILFFEERIVDISKTDIMINQLRLSGIFDKISALIIGKSVEILPNKQESFEEMILRNTEEFEFPIISDVLLGHTEDKITIPISCNVRIDLTNKALLLLESPFLDQ